MPKGKQRVLKKIPEKVIQNAVGLAIFTTMRTGLWISGAGGSGVLIARQEDGEWSPPSGILLHTAGLGFLVGVDIYDCVVVINNRKALEAFTKIRATLGGEISAVAGPVGVGGVLENDGKWKQANRPVFTYLKSRGFYAGIQVDGTVIVERSDENERFYGQKIPVADILAGKARHPPPEIKMLMETVKAAEGRTDVDRELMDELAAQPAPGDFDVESPGSATFGIPEPDDPDPFGVLALEQAGLEIREAGTRSRPSSTQFEYNPSPTSPIYSKFHRLSMETGGSRSNRESYLSNRSSRGSRSRLSIDRGTQTMDFGSQTDDLTPETSPSYSDEHKRIVEEEPEEIDYTKVDLGPFSHLNRSQDFDGTTVNNSPREHDLIHHVNGADNSYATEDEDYDEEPVIFEAASAQATVIMPQAVKARGGLVDIPKRPGPPPLPPRNQARSSQVLMVDRASGQTPVRSPTKDGFEDVDLHGVGNLRKSSETQKQVVENGEATPKRNSLEDMVDAGLKDGNLDGMSPVSPLSEEASLNFESHEIRHSEELDEKDDFHSMPPTPNEQRIEEKA